MHANIKYKSLLLTRAYKARTCWYRGLESDLAIPDLKQKTKKLNIKKEGTETFVIAIIDKQKSDSQFITKHYAGRGLGKMKSNDSARQK